MKKLKLKLWHIIISSILIGIIISVLTGMFNQQFVASLKKDYPSETEYNVLKDYATVYAKTLDSSFIEDDDISISHAFQENSLCIIVEDSGRCKIEAEYPFKTEIAGNGTFVTKISFEKVKYQETSFVKSIPHTIFILILICVVYSCLLTIVVSELCRIILEKKANSVIN